MSLPAEYDDGAGGEHAARTAIARNDRKYRDVWVGRSVTFLS
jgi:hypothetical protein